MSNTARVGTAMAWSVSTRAIRFALSLATSVVVVRSLGEHDYGAYSIVRSMMMFVTLLAASAPSQLLLKFVPALRVSGARDEARRILLRVTVYIVLAWAVVAAIAWMGQGVVARVFDVTGVGTAFAAAAGLVLFELIYQALSQLLHAGYDTKRLGISGVVCQLVYLLLLWVLLPRGWGIVGVFASFAAGNLVAVLMVLDRVRAAVSFERGEGGEAIEGGRLIRYAAPFAAIGVLNVVVWRQSETLLLGYFRGAVEAGYFDLAYRLPQMILEFVPATVWPLVMAAVSESYARDPSRLAAGLERYYRMLFVLCAPVCVTGMVLGGSVITVLYGDAMAASAMPARWFFGIFTLSFFATPLSMGLYVMEKTHVNLLVYLLLAVINVGLDLVLIPRYGVTGAMIPVAVAMFVSPFIYRLVLGGSISGLRIPVRFIGKCFLAAAPVAVLLPVTDRVDNIWKLIVALATACVILLISFRKVRVLAHEDLSALESIPVPMAGRFLKFMSS